ncbi:MAG TPA: alkaline phosphatase D family protein [Burkholderiaceae bacterium]|nr:alkaline phosphatase D family protein [Burkholderiaceae bacterium]HQZ04696.1 alkaline phosphatase D family protein [Burkholderiaceae bacterium]HRA60969.1 alkaline phosphatase D family protein [Burkholderiaceae bacterium]
MNLFDLPFRVLRNLPSPLDFPQALKDLSDDVRARMEARPVPVAVAKRLPLVDDSQISGMQVGEVGADSAIIWARLPYACDVAVAWSAQGPEGPWNRIRAPQALEVTDFTTRVRLRGLPADSTIHVSIVALALEAANPTQWVRGTSFRSAPASRRPVRFAWSADVNGQGFGINPEAGGMRIFETMRQRELDFFVHCGDTIYADHPLQHKVDDERGRSWSNIVSLSKTKVAETIAEYRGNFRYNWLDPHFARFCSEVPQVVMWDDHEVVNNWSPSLDLQRDQRYRIKDLKMLAATAARAFREYSPMPLEGFDEAGALYRRVSYGPQLDLFVLDMQTYRGPNSHNLQAEAGDDTAFLGRAQIDWLKKELLASTAQWKVIAAGMPIGINVADGHDAQGRVKWQGVANGDDGAPKGREIELADLLSFIKRHAIHNMVWLCADVHYTAAHYFDPAQAAYPDFLPFWEFVSGPLHAGSYGPFGADATFGVQVRYSRASPVRGASPAAGFQFFGEVAIDPDSGCLTVQLCDVSGSVLHTEVIAPHPPCV